MAKYTHTFDIHTGCWDGVPVNRVPENATAWSRQADYGYPQEVRMLPGMTRHVTSTAQTFIAASGNNRVNNIWDAQLSGSNYLLCLKGDGATYDKLWDITGSTTVTNIIQVTRPGSDDRMYQQPWSVAQWDDEVFIVNGQSPIDQGASFTYGLALSYSGGWTISDIGVSYAAAKTTGAPSTAVTTGSGSCFPNANYGFRVLGYDTTKGSYGGLSGILGTNMEVWQETGTVAQDIVVTVTQSATDLGVDELRIFRTTRNGSDMFFEGSLTGASAAFTTTMTDQELIHQAAYDASVGGTPPDTFYLIARHNERLVGIGINDDSRLYFSQPSRPHEWEVGSYRELPNLGRPVGLTSRGHIMAVHYDTGLIATLTGPDVKAATIATDCKEVYGSVNDGSIVEATYKSYHISNEGLMVFTGQACPQKVSYAIDGTWEAEVTRASLTQVSAVLNERPRRKEYWALLPADNLLITAPVESTQPGTLMGVQRCYGTTLGRRRTAGETRVFLGTNEGAVFELDTGNAYGTEAQLKDTTVSSASTSEFVISGGATTSYGHLSMPFVITGGAARGGFGWITANGVAATQTITPDFSIIPSTDDRVLIGALPFDIYSGWLDLGRPGKWKTWLGVRVNALEDVNASNRSALLNVYAVGLDYLPLSPRSEALDWELVGQVDCQIPENEWIGLDIISTYVAFRFVCYDYQITRTLQSFDLEYEYLREGPM